MPTEEIIFDAIVESSEEAAPASAANYEEIAALAYEYWIQRGCPIGSPEVDWFRAEEQLKNQARSVAMAEALISKNLAR